MATIKPTLTLVGNAAAGTTGTDHATPGPTSIALDLSGWSNTNNITDMTNFMRANSTTNSPFSSLNTTGWNTSGVTKLDYAFLRAAF